MSLRARALAAGVLLAACSPTPGPEPADPSLVQAQAQLEALLASTSTVEAEPLLVLRRLHLALVGSIPSLEVIRGFEAEPPAGRLDRALERLLADPRFDRYLAERWARALVGGAEEPFLVFRREALVTWLEGQLAARRPFDQTVRAMITARGLWTGSPAVNFLTAASTEGEIDEALLAGRTARVLLGERVECAQCHDHPFADFSRSQFQGLAAFYATARITALGVSDASTATISPAVPYGAEWLPAEGAPRERLAAWVTHPAHRAFGRAVANRVWAMLFGRALVEPVDDLDAEATPAARAVLELLGEDFQRHGADLRRLIRLIAGSAVFRRPSSGAPAAEWADFPLRRLRGEQLAGALVQAGMLGTADRRAHPLMRMVRYFQAQDHARAHGDPGDRELDPRPGTVQQALLAMNGALPRAAVEGGPFGSVGPISSFAESDARRLELLFLVFLSRRPGEEERRALLPRLAGREGRAREEAMQDLAWALACSAEMSWSH